MLIIFTPLRWMLRNSINPPSSRIVLLDQNQIHPKEAVIDDQKKDEHLKSGQVESKEANHDEEKIAIEKKIMEVEKGNSISSDEKTIGNFKVHAIHNQKNKNKKSSSGKKNQDEIDFKKSSNPISADIETIEKIIPSPFNTNQTKRPSAYKHLKSNSFDLNSVNSSQDLKHRDDSKTMCSSPTSPRNSKIFSLDDENQPKVSTPKQSLKDKMNQPSKIKRITGYFLMMLVGVGSGYLIWTISANSSSNSWPWGFWYVAALFFDQFIFQPVIALLIFPFLHRLINQPKDHFGESLARRIIGNDILAVIESKLKLI